MPSTRRAKGRARGEMFIDAELQEARLIGEQLRTFEDKLAELLGDQKKRKLSIHARTQINNSMAVQFDEKSNKATLLRVIADISVTVFTAERPDDSLASYTSQYAGYFQISRSQNVKKGEPIETQAFAAFAKQVNWLATRRADGALAATGIANLRLSVPSIGMKSAEVLPDADSATGSR